MLATSTAGFPTTPNPDADVREACVGDLTLAAFAVPYLGARNLATVVVGIDARRDAPVPGGAVGERVDVTMRVRATGTTPQPSLPERRMSLTVWQDVEGPLGEHAPLLTELTLPPGTYEIQLSTSPMPGAPAREPALVVPLTIPAPLPPNASGFLMSPLVLATNRSAERAMGDAKPEWRQLPILLRPPSPRRMFRRTERIELYVEIYDGQSARGQELQFAVTTVVTDTAGAVRYRMEETGISEPLVSGRYGFAHSALVPISQLQPGRYHLAVRARTLTEPIVQTWQATAFTVLPSTAQERR